jgi:sigma-B regulation protein RsbU (phosphoserine phosphatase)
VNAAIFMALVHALVVAEGRRQASPQIVARRVHHLLLELAKPTMPVSVFYGVVDVQECVMRYINAGSALALLRHANGAVEMLPGEANMLAASLHTDVEERAISLHKGCVLLLPSAGLIAAQNASGEAYGTDRLQNALKRGPETPQELKDFVLADLDAHCAGAPQHGDQTLLVMRHAT